MPGCSSLDEVIWGHADDPRRQWRASARHDCALVFFDNVYADGQVDGAMTGRTCEADHRFDSTHTAQALGLTATPYRDGITATQKD